MFHNKESNDVGYIVYKFEENRSKITAVKVPERILQNGRHDVIKMKFSKSEKNGTGKNPRVYFYGFSSKSVEPCGL